MSVVLSGYLALSCTGCTKKGLSSQAAPQEKEISHTRAGEPEEGTQLAAAEAATVKTDSVLQVNDLVKLRSVAEQGNTRAQRLLGVMYSTGQGVPQDYSVGARWFKKAAAGGDRVAYVDLGVLYRQGLGVPKDPIAAYMWFSLAAQKGDAYSEKALAQLSSVLNRQQLLEAQARTAEWQKNYPK